MVVWGVLGWVVRALGGGSSYERWLWHGFVSPRVKLGLSTWCPGCTLGRVGSGCRFAMFLKCDWREVCVRWSLLRDNVDLARFRME